MIAGEKLISMIYQALVENNLLKSYNQKKFITTPRGKNWCKICVLESATIFFDAEYESNKFCNQEKAHYSGFPVINCSFDSV